MALAYMHQVETLEYKITEIMNKLTLIENRVKDLEYQIKKNNGPVGPDVWVENPWKGINIAPSHKEG